MTITELREKVAEASELIGIALDDLNGFGPEQATRRARLAGEGVVNAAEKFSDAVNSGEFAEEPDEDPS